MLLCYNPPYHSNFFQTAIILFILLTSDRQKYSKALIENRVNSAL
jgi:hypothetical protein